jgi:protein-tyrosine phosphatase
MKGDLFLTDFFFGPASSRDNIVFGAEKPGHDVQAWITFMRRQGIERVCCLLEKETFSGEYNKAFGKENVKVAPIEDYHYSTSENLTQVIIPFLSDSYKKDKPVVVHCFAGNGRTGHVLAAWLCFKYQLNPVEAISAIEKTGRNLREAIERGYEISETLINLLEECRQLGRPNL